MAAEFQLGGEAIVVSVANPGTEPLVVEVPVPDIRVSAVVPDGAEGLSPYLAGRPKGHWYKWKRAPLMIDALEGPTTAVLAGDALLTAAFDCLARDEGGSAPSARLAATSMPISSRVAAAEELGDLFVHDPFGGGKGTDPPH